MTKNTKRIRVAFIKFGGLASGGTEKALQTIAANLPKDKFDITYFYCDSAPYIGSDWKHPDTDPSRVAYMKSHNVKLVKFNVAYKDVRTHTHDWIDTDFWDVFNEEEYDLIQTGRAGHPEYPFTHIKQTPIVDSIHLPGHIDHNPLVKAVIHVSKWNKDYWVKLGGDEKIAHVVYHPIKLPKKVKKLSLKDMVGYESGTVVFGFHQRPDDGIFSPIPLKAYSKIQNENTAFVILGGSKKYSEQAKDLQLTNFLQLHPTGEVEYVVSFLRELDVYCHGRSDGENNSQAIAEAMGTGLPVLSHVAPAMGHKEQIGNCGHVADNVEEYSRWMEKLLQNENYRKDLGEKAKEKFEKVYSLTNNIQKVSQIYENVYDQTRQTTFDDAWLKDWLQD